MTNFGKRGTDTLTERNRRGALRHHACACCRRDRAIVADPGQVSAWPDFRRCGNPARAPELLCPDRSRCCPELRDQRGVVVVWIVSGAGRCLRRSSRTSNLAVAERRNRYAVVGIFVELVAQ